MITEKTNVWRSGLSSLAKSLARVLSGSGLKKQSGSSGAYLAVFTALATLSLLFTPNTTLAQDDPPAVKQLTVSFDKDSYTAIENGARAMVTVSLDDETDRTVAIPITTSPATGDHFSLSTSTVYFDPGDRSQTIYLTAEDDTNTANETVRLSFGSPLPDGVSAGTQSTASVTLWDDDLKELTISFGAATYRAREESFDATVAITLDSPSDRALRIPITATLGTGTDAGDYKLSAMEVVFEANQSRKTITVSAERDDDLTNGSVVLGFGTLPVLVSTSPESFSTTTVNLEDDGRRVVTFDAAEHTATEEGADATVTVNVTPPPNADVSIRISVSPPPASTNPDFTVATLTGGALTVGTGGSATFTVTANDDSDMVSEKITFTIVGPLPATVNYGEHQRTVVTLMDNDMTTETDPTVAFARTTHNAHEGGGAVTVAANLSKASSKEVMVPFTAAITGGTNPVEADYELSATQFVFAPNQRRATITVTAKADEDITLETLTLTFDGPGADAGYTLGGTQDSTIVRLIDDSDRTVTIAASATTLVEGDTSNTVDLTVTIAPVPTADVMIPITINPGSGDFTVPNNRRVTVGTSGTGTFTITAKEDDGNTRDQEVTFALGGLPSNFKKGSANSVKVTMLDVTRPAVSFGKDRYFAVENGDAAEVELMLSVPSDKDLTVSVTPTGDDANAYLLSARRVTFAKGTVGPEKITVVAASDSDVALDTVTLALGPEVAANTDANDDLIPGAIVSTIVDLIDDGLRVVSFGTTTPAANLNNGDAGTVEVTLSGAALATGEIAIPITVMSDSEGFTLEGTAYDVAKKLLTFSSANASPQTITVTAVADEDSKSNDVEFGFGALPVSVRAGSPSTAKVQLQEPGTTDEGDDTSVLSFAAASYSAQENGDPNMAVVAITLDPARDEKVTVPVTIGGDATDTDAYSTTLPGNPGNVVFNAGETRKTITVTAKSDADAVNESITLSLDASTVTPADSVTLGGQASTAVNILDDGQAKGTVTFSADQSVVEGTSVTVTVTLGASRTGDLTIPINTDPASGDFILSPPRRVTIPAGELSQTITLTSSADDMDIEEDMKVTLSFGALPSDLLPGTPATTTVTWTDNDRDALTVSFAETTYSVDEGDEVKVTINLDQEADRTVRIPITVDSSSTATKEDYTLSAMEVVFEEGEDENDGKTITLTAIEDPDASPDQTVVLSFGTLPGGVTDGGDSTVTITDTHNAVTIAFGATGYAAIEGGAVAEIPVTLNADTNRDLMIPINTEPKGGPFMLEGVTGEQGNYMLAFAKDSQSAMITVRATDDPDALDQMVTLSFDANNLPDGVTLAGTQNTAAVTLVDDGVRMPTVSFDKTAYMAMEGDPDDAENPGTPATVMIELDPPLPSGSRETLTIAVSGWPATAPATPNHFTLNGEGNVATVTFGPGEKSKTITVEATPNQTPETLDGTVKLIFGAMPPPNVPEGVRIPSQEMGGEAVVTLVDDDRNDAIVAYFMPVESPAMEGGEAAMVSVGLDLGEDVELDRNITLLITDTPSEGAEGDYTVEPKSVEFSAGTAAAELWATITVTANLDDDNDNETVTLGLGMLSPGVMPGETAEQPATAEVTIEDDGQALLTVAFAQAEYSATEGGDAATVTVSLSAAADRDITIPITATPATGSEASYEAPMEVMIASGAMSADIMVTASHDEDTEDGSVTLGLGDLPAHVSAGDQATTTVTLTDDGLVPLKVIFASATYTATENGDAATVSVILNRPADREVTVPITMDPEDGPFELSADEVTFAEGDNRMNITVTATEDVDTADAMVTLGFGDLPERISVGEGQPNTVVTLTDDGVVTVAVSFDAAEYTATEGGADATVMVNLDMDPGRDITIPINVNPAEGDFMVSAMEVSFASGEMSKEISVMATLDDDTDDDMVTLSLGALPDRVSMGANTTAEVTLKDDGMIPLTVSFAAAEYTATEGGAAADVMVSLDVASDRDVTIPVTTDPAEGDFSLSANEVSFAAGDMSQMITVTATSDDDVDDEMVTLSLGDLPMRVSAGDPTSTTVTLVDKGYTVTFAVARQTVRESERGTVTANISPAANGSVSVPLSVTHQGGATAADYSGVPGSLAFSGGSSQASFTVAVMADEENDPGESIDVSFGTLPDKVNAGDITMTTVEFEQFRTAEQFSRTLQAALAVVAGAMGDSAVNAIETRFERFRENMGNASAAADNFERTYGHLSDMESPSLAMNHGSQGMDNGFVPMATNNPATGLNTGSTGYGRSHTSGSYEEAISLGALASTARPGESVIASGYGMAPNGEQDVNFSGVAFEMAMEHGDEGKFSPVVWVQGDLQRFDGEIEDIGMDFDGGLDAIHLGVDLYANGQTLAGVSVMQSWGDLDYTDDGVDGSLDSSMSTFHPYVYFQPNSNLGVWGILGFGSGSIDVSEPDRTHEFDADFSMFAGGVRSVLNRRDNNELGLSADAFMAELSTDAADDIPGVKGEAQRARVMVDWLSNSTMAEGQDLAWKAEIGGRFDGGDGIQGAGIEAGFRVGLVDSDQGLDVALGARALLFHENDASDYGIGVQVTWDPGEKNKGMVASVGSSYGQDRGGSTSLWDNGNSIHSNGLGAMWQETQVRVDGEIGYAGILTPLGLPGTVMPYSRARWSGYGQEFGVGTRWTPAETSERNLLPATFELEGLTRETRSGLEDVAVLLRMSIPFGGEKAIEPRHSRNRPVSDAAMGPSVASADNAKLPSEDTAAE